MVEKPHVYLHDVENMKSRLINVVETFLATLEIYIVCLQIAHLVVPLCG